MIQSDTYAIHPIGVVRSELTDRRNAPRQGNEGSPNAWLQISSEFIEAIDGLSTGAEILVFTWLHLADRATLKTHPRNNAANPLTGVFATRSPDRPNPIGMHKVTVFEINKKDGLKVGPLEAIDGTPVIDIKPVLRTE
ncbi:tRNA (N6-threonylcarbamoyladenosine(37)-N6)-methyltransferase TrmO [Edaphobacter albus]|uniref:tRNA (N6-threonylcarbamoyladenosine(37)-N6)-methyltransferase TrmO n=1 Tax=Edaphobacter sp. 4G125 TaxID=2763071 RepID=UPI00210284DF|nr:tRNA (N6-threonylcarbamoyladenosine(37)-N6)-methyltransferase TrmO [Edaphobacter sp. 4G125]